LLSEIQCKTCTLDIYWMIGSNSIHLPTDDGAIQFITMKTWQFDLSLEKSTKHFKTTLQLIKILRGAIKMLWKLIWRNEVWYCQYSSSVTLLCIIYTYHSSHNCDYTDYMDTFGMFDSNDEAFSWLQQYRFLWQSCVCQRIITKSRAHTFSIQC